MSLPWCGFALHCAEVFLQQPLRARAERNSPLAKLKGLLSFAVANSSCRLEIETRDVARGGGGGDAK